MFCWLRPIITFIQRGRRGWAEEDAWCAYSHISRVIYEMLEWLRKNNHGVPPSYRLENDPNLVASSKAWEEDLCKMILTFRILEKSNMSHVRFQSEEMYLKYEEDIKEGMKLFFDNFQSLWD